MPDEMPIIGTEMSRINDWYRLFLVWDLRHHWDRIRVHLTRALRISEMSYLAKNTKNRAPNNDEILMIVA